MMWANKAVNDSEALREDTSASCTAETHQATAWDGIFPMSSNPALDAALGSLAVCYTLNCPRGLGGLRLLPMVTPERASA